jgi:hypothetical protein
MQLVSYVIVLSHDLSRDLSEVLPKFMNFLNLGLSL